MCYYKCGQYLRIQVQSTVSKQSDTRVRMLNHILFILFVFRDLCTGKMKEIGKEDVELYLLLNHLTQDQLQYTSCVVKENNTSQLHILESWHKRLGQMSSHILSKLFFVSTETFNKSLNNCSIYYAKQTRAAFLVSNIKSSDFFYLVHMNVLGSYKNYAFDGNKYIFIIIDDFARMI